MLNHDGSEMSSSHLASRNRNSSSRILDHYKSSLRSGSLTRELSSNGSICVLLGVLAVSLYNTAGQNKIAEIFGFIYLAIAIFAGIWGTAMHRVRRNMIVERSGKDFDNMIGPMVVSFALMMSLILNFYFQYHAAMERLNDPVHGNVPFINTEPLKTEVKIELL